MYFLDICLVDCVFPIQTNRKYCIGAFYCNDLTDLCSTLRMHCFFPIYWFLFCYSAYWMTFLLYYFPFSFRKSFLFHKLNKYLRTSGNMLPINLQTAMVVRLRVWKGARFFVKAICSYHVNIIRPALFFAWLFKLLQLCKSLVESKSGQNVVKCVKMATSHLNFM